MLKLQPSVLLAVISTVSQLSISIIINVEEPVLMELGIIALLILITGVVLAMNTAPNAQDLSTLNAQNAQIQPMDLLYIIFNLTPQFVILHVLTVSLLILLYPIFV